MDTADTRNRTDVKKKKQTRKDVYRYDCKINCTK